MNHLGAPRRNVKLVPLQVDLVEQLYSMSSSMGVPFKTLINMLVEKGIKIALLNNGNLNTVDKEYFVQKAFSRIGFTMVPLPLLSRLVERMDEREYKEALAEALETGRNIGMLLTLDEDQGDEVKIEYFLRALFPEASQIKVQRQGKSLKIALIIHGRSKKLIEVPLTLLRGALYSMGYEELKVDYNPGLILADFRKIR